MKFSQYLLLEDPDESHSSAEGGIQWWSKKDARTFGFVDLSEKRTFPSNFTKCKLTFSGFESQWPNTVITAQQPKVTHHQLVQNYFLDRIWNESTEGIISFSDIEEVIDFSDPHFRGNRENLPTKIQNRIEGMDARAFLNPAGRLWLEGQVVSFWVSDPNQVSKEYLERVFDDFDLPKEVYETYIIEFLGQDKATLTVKEFLSGNKTINPLSKEQEKRASEALARVHLAAAQGTKDVDVQNIIKQRKSALQQQDALLRTQGKIPSLQTRQMATTSESTFPSFREYVS